MGEEKEKTFLKIIGDVIYRREAHAFCSANISIRYCVGWHDETVFLSKSSVLPTFTRTNQLVKYRNNRPSIIFRVFYLHYT